MYIRIFFILLILLTNCKSEIRKKKKSQPYISNLTLKENLSNFTSKMTEKDTVKIMAELGMEWWVRRDELVLTKNKDKIYLQTKIMEDTTFEGKYQMRTNILKEISIENSDNSFEKHFMNKIDRTKNNKSKGWIYRIFSQNDTLTFYTDGLGDKGGELQEYFRFMLNYYPDEKEFKPMQYIEESEYDTVGNNGYKK